MSISAAKRIMPPFYSLTPLLYNVVCCNFFRPSLIVKKLFQVTDLTQKLGVWS